MSHSRHDGCQGADACYEWGYGTGFRAAVDNVRALCDEARAFAPDTSGMRVLSVAAVLKALDEALGDD